MDPWAVTQVERERHFQYFNSLGPVQGFVTGLQVRGFMQQSQLPNTILAQIWNLSDVNGDGRMDLNEFSIACKLITMKLKGFEIPASLPPALRVLAVPAAPSAPGVMPPMPVAAPGMVQQPPVPLPGMVPPSSVPPASIPGVVAQQYSSSFTPPAVQSPPRAAVPTITSPPSASSQPGSRKHSDVGVSPTEWSVPHNTKLKYTMIFNQADHAKVGHLTGVQARPLLLQTQVAPMHLAKIWELSDIDSNGLLTCEEFVLAMYLTDCLKRGEHLPNKLPPDLVPPTFRKRSLAGTPGSQQSLSPVASQTNQGSTGHAPSGDPAQPVANGSGSNTPSSVFAKSFEDKRKENFDKGQEELEKRRRALEEIQKKEEEERQRKAREEEERRERERVEAEARRQEEIRKMQEKERERQAALEAERQRQIEAKEAARREQERLAQLEWEKQKKTELLQMKQTQQEKVVNLKAQNQKMSIELSSLTSKIKELTEQVADTRAGIAGVKHSIDGMRTTRDSKVKAINDAKMSLKEQNQRLMNVVQEKAKLAEKSRKDGGSGIDGEEDAMAAAIQRKQATNKTLKEELETVTTENDALDKEVKSKLEELNTLKETMGECHLSAKKTYQTYLEKRQWIMDKREKEKKALYDPNAAWGASVDDTSFDAPAAAEPEPVAVRGPSETSDVERVKFVALYPFEARNPDEVSFQPGDIIMVNLDDRTGEEGWLQGDLENGGGSGWFPEAYAEKYDPAKHNGVAAVPEPQTVNFDAAFPPSSTEPEAPVKNESGFDSLVNHQDSFVGFQKDPFAPENAAQPTSGAPVAAEVTASEYVALYTYTSEEPGDLVFQQGQVIKVIAKDGDWWTGVLEDGSKGIFPANYVTPKEDAFADHFTAPASTANSVTPLEEPPKEEPVPPETQPAHLDGGTDEETDVSPKGVSKKILIAKVIAPYEATTKEQLSLQRGQLIQVYKKSSSGWWEGELQAKGQGRLRGWFPGTYVKVLAGSTSAVSSARTSPVPKSFLEGLGEPPLPSGKEFVVALYPYTAQHSDELSFQKGDVMKLISREEENWWRCELHGKVGLLPAVYVEITKAPQSIS